MFVEREDAQRMARREFPGIRLPGPSLAVMTGSCLVNAALPTA
jgi:hypothetical protein